MAFDKGSRYADSGRARDEDGLVEKKMLGGPAMLLHGNMAVGVHGESLIVRTDPAAHAALLAEPGA